MRYGVVKVNVDTDMQYAFTRAVGDHLRERDRGADDKSMYDPRSWGRVAEAAMADAVAEQCRLLGSAGRTLARM